MEVLLFFVAPELALYSMNRSVVLEELQIGNPSVKTSLYLAQLEEEDHGTVKIENMPSYGETNRGDDCLYLRNHPCPYVCLSLSPVRSDEIWKSHEGDRVHESVPCHLQRMEITTS